MREIILNFPKQFQEGISCAKDIRIKKKFQNFCLCGMGGSALGGSLIQSYLNEKEIKTRFIVQRGYSIPYFINKDWLVIIVSYSGNTEETINCFREAVKNGLQMVAISSNGKLEKIAKSKKVPLILIPKGYPPRMALGYQFGAIIKILQKAGIKLNLNEILDLNKISPKSQEQSGKILAKNINKAVPLIYASDRFKILARIWKIKFNENTKIPAFWNYFPELNHNEMTGFENYKNQDSEFYFIILRDKNDMSRIKKRMQLTAKMLKKQGLKGQIIDLKGKTFLQKLFQSIILADWTSFYLAKIYGTDPVPVKLVEEFKKQLKKS